MSGNVDVLTDEVRENLGMYAEADGDEAGLGMDNEAGGRMGRDARTRLQDYHNTTIDPVSYILLNMNI
jgi:hypothetical protein